MKRTIMTFLLCLCLCGMITTRVHASGNVTVSNVTSSTAYVDWSVMVTANEEYTYSYADIYIGDNLITTGCTGTSGTITGLQANTYYQVWVYAYFTDTDGAVHTDSDFEGFVTGSLSNVDTDAPSTPDTSVTPDTTTPSDTTTPTDTTTPIATTLATPAVGSAEVVDNVLYLTGANLDPYAQKIEWQIYDKKTGQCVASDYSYNVGTEIYSFKGKKVFYAICRVVGYDSNYNEVYSEWSPKKYFVTQPKVTSTKKDVKKNSVTIKWKKVTGAKNYTIYAKKKNAKKWTKVKTTSKTSYKLTKLKGKRINTYNSEYSFRVVTNAKVSGKTIKSSNKEYYTAYTY